VFGLALRIVGQRQDAEDVAQQTFLSVLESVDQFREEAAVATWILRIAANHALKTLRKRRGLPTVSLPDDPESCNRRGLRQRSSAAATARTSSGSRGCGMPR